MVPRRIANTALLLFSSIIVYRPSLAYSKRIVAFMSPAEIRTLSTLEQVEIPDREYGYRKTPLTWPELTDIVEVEKNLAKLSRSVEQQRIYIVYRNELLKEWKSVYDHILVSKFNLEQRLVDNPNRSDGRNSTLWESYPALSELNEIKNVLKPNDFPYYTAEGIEHWCLWKVCEDVNDDEIENAKLDLQAKHGDIVSFLSWRNPPHLKSLPDIDHIHILCLRDPTGAGTVREKEIACSSTSRK